MRKVLLLLLSAALCAAASAQVDQGRDLSKYADDKFGLDDQYTVTTPYETVVVKPVRSRRIKNVIVLIGDGMGVEQVSMGWVLNGGRLNMDNFQVTGGSRTYSATASRIFFVWSVSQAEEGPSGGAGSRWKGWPIARR